MRLIDAPPARLLALDMAWKQLRRQWQSGDLRVLMMALVLAVAASTAVGLFTERVYLSMLGQGNLLIGADLALNADHALPNAYTLQAQQAGLEVAHSMEFPSMAIVGEQTQLVQIKAVSHPFPLRGTLTLSQRLSGAGYAVRAAPASGTVWIEPRLAEILYLKQGDHLQLGQKTFVISAFLLRETSRGGNFMNIAPRVMMALPDVAETGLEQYGSRIRYALLIRGNPRSVADFKTWLQAALKRGERIEDTSAARPEIKSTLDKAEQFLGLASMAALLLSMVAMFLASQPYVQKSLDAFALMRCFGASKALIFRILLLQTLLIGLIGSSAGALIGYLAQAGLAGLAGQLFADQLPAATLRPLWLGLLVGLGVTLAVLWPAMQQMREVPAMRILRRDVASATGRHWLNFLPMLGLFLLLLSLQAGSIRLAAMVLVVVVALLLVLGLLAWVVHLGLQRLPAEHLGVWRIGLAGLKRRPLMSLVQVVGLSLGLLAVLLLSMVRGDLIENWRATLPADAPNRFVINIQPDQVSALQDFFGELRVPPVKVYPIVRARLVAVNQQKFDSTKFQDERARRLAEREFNMSWSEALPEDNTLLQGAWWIAEPMNAKQVSLEIGLAEKLGLKLGDVLTYEIGGTRIDLRVSSIRKVAWDKMHANFFAMTPPGVLNEFAQSYLCSFHLPVGREGDMHKLVQRFSNLTVIDVSNMMQQVREMIERMSHAVEYVFAFSLLAGVMVLYAALVATREERVQESTLMRVLGASRRQVMLAMLTEFFVIGLIAALVAVTFANLLAAYVSLAVLEIPYHFNGLQSFLLVLAASAAIPMAAWLGVSAMANQPPKRILQA